MLQLIKRNAVVSLIYSPCLSPFLLKHLHQSVSAWRERPHWHPMLKVKSCDKPVQLEGQVEVYSKK